MVCTRRAAVDWALALATISCSVKLTLSCPKVTKELREKKSAILKIASLFISKGSYGILICRSFCRSDAKHQPNSGCHAKRNKYGRKSDDRGEIAELRNQAGQYNAKNYSNNAPGHTDHHGFKQKLVDNIGFFGAQGQPQPDFLYPFHHRGKHDVHDSYPSHQEGYARNGPQDDIKYVLGTLLLFK